MSEFALYSYFRSSASYRVRLALQLKGIPFEYRAVHLLHNGGEQHKPEYREVNPSGEVPTLIHRGRAIGQSMAILEYLDEVAPGAPLFPADPYQKAVVRQMCEIINCMQPLQNLKLTQYLGSEMGLGPSLRQTWMNHWQGQGFAALEKLLAKHSGTYSLGDRLSAADCFLVPQVFAARRFNIDLQRCPQLLRVHSNLEKLPDFQKAHPSKQPDFQA